jgi:hypothetical protein
LPDVPGRSKHFLRHLLNHRINPYILLLQCYYRNNYDAVHPTKL